MIILLLKKFKIKIGNIYFIEHVLEVSKDKVIGKITKKSQGFLLDMVENVTRAKK